MPRQHRSHGFTLIEIVVALGILAVVTTQVLGLVATQQKNAASGF